MSIDVPLMLGSVLVGGFVGWHVRAAYGRGMAAYRKVRGGWAGES